MTIVTRNAPDFAGTGVRILNPFNVALKKQSHHHLCRTFRHSM